MSSTRCSCPILKKLGFSRRIFEKYSNIKPHENPSSGSRALPCGRTDGQTDGHDEANISFWEILRTHLRITHSNFGIHLSILSYARTHARTHVSTQGSLNVHWKRMFQQKLCHESLTSSPVLMLTCVITCQMGMSVIMSVSVLIMNYELVHC
jgi:hypothetical protein